MKHLGFIELEKQWIFPYIFLFPKTKRFKDVHLKGILIIPTGQDTFTFLAIDETTGKPFEYMNYLAIDKKHKVARIVFHRIEYLIKHFQYNGVLTIPKLDKQKSLDLK